MWDVCCEVVVLELEGGVFFDDASECECTYMRTYVHKILAAAVPHAMGFV